MEKKYEIKEERQNKVSETAVASDALIESKNQEAEATFDRDWERAISLEEFHERCIRKLKEMYGKA